MAVLLHQITLALRRRRARRAVTGLRAVARIWLGIAASIAMLAPQQVALGQTEVGASPTRLRVTVTDTAGDALVGAEVLLTRDGATVVAQRTDQRGMALLTGRIDPGSYELIARLMGYRHERASVPLRSGDSLEVVVTLARIVQTLDPVRVRGRQGTRRLYHLDAAEIASSTRLVRNAMDAMLALRPHVFAGLGGWDVCGTLQEVWINGERIRQDFIPDPRWVGRQMPHVPPEAPPVPPQVMSILSRVRAEHIAEVTHQDCFGGGVHANGSVNALFIVLVPGAAFRWPEGSYMAQGRRAP